MANKNIDKELYGPSVTEVALGAVLGLLAGVLVACVYLVFKPVAQVKELPKEPARSVVYYIPGTDSNAKSRGWQAKQKQFLAGTSITVVEDEMNAWAATLSAPAAAKPGTKPAPAAKPDEAKPAPEGLIIPYAPNFKVVGDKLQIGFKCTLNWYGLTYDTTVIATGVFGRSGDQVAFVPEKFYLGSCPMHLLPGLSGLIGSYVISKEKVPDEVRTAWTKLADVTIEGGAVKFSVQ
ncbi:MAG: hypothetical protein PSV13_10505 [Lacunisphaera sp.]|nr:hypothetical protein [Lacunisphaera sp.]